MGCDPRATRVVFALSLLGLGLVFRDGLAVLLSMLAGGAAVAYTAGLGVLAWHWGLGPLLQWMQI